MNYKKALPLFLSFLFVFLIFAEGFGAIKASAEINSGIYVQVLIYEDEDESIFAEVPKSMVGDYKKDLENESFLNDQIQQANGISSSQDGEITTYASCGSASTKYYRKSDVLKLLKHYDNTRNWNTLLSNPLADYAVTATITRLLSGSNIAAIAATTLTWVAVDIMTKSEKFWRDSALMILTGEITGVKLTITPNCKTNYPAVYRVLKRY